jgi:hypothetical protein
MYAIVEGAVHGTGVGATAMGGLVGRGMGVADALVTAGSVIGSDWPWRLTPQPAAPPATAATTTATSIRRPVTAW